MGVATTLDAPGNMLSSNALLCLRTCKFVLGSPTQRMDAIAEAVLLRPCSWFSVGHKVALFMRDYFLKHDGTLTSFIRALKVQHLILFHGLHLIFYVEVLELVFWSLLFFSSSQIACMEHFSSEALSFLLKDIDAEDDFQVWFLSTLIIWNDYHLTSYACLIISINRILFSVDMDNLLVNLLLDPQIIILMKKFMPKFVWRNN